MRGAKEQAFLQAIAESPDDDTPRLVFADWLDDHGDPARAEFIRVQIELASQPGDDTRRRALQDREEDLLRAHEDEWRARLAPVPHSTWGPFTRGFVERVEIYTQEDFLAHAAALFASAPLREL